ncbi:S8 family serine peptidase [Pontiella sp.]|uniref:S8 family serine peptidase n=1 Tax=Pontiella sp. TaxID=2837462 RepID=UPI003561D746
MNRWICQFMPVLFALMAWADAEALRLSELGRPDLAELGTELSELRRARRTAVRARAEVAETTEMLVKFRARERVLSLTVDAGAAAQAVEVLSARNDVEFAEANRRLQRQLVPSDPLYANQWHHATIGSSPAWEWGTGSADVKIAIVDLPFNLDHPDLAANAVRGWDVVNEAPVYEGNDDHASMSAGMAAAVVGNGTGIAGAGNCTLVPVKNTSGLTSDIVDMDAAIRWCADNGIRVVNLSWDGAYSDVLNLAAQYLRETADGVVVMAGVNGVGLLDYTNQPYIIAVSMTDGDDRLQSHYGPHIDFSAPGYQVYSTTAAGYGTGSGTSYAAPLVSGVLATLFSISPALAADDAIAILKATATDLGAPGWDPQFGWGRIEFGHAAWLAAAAGGGANLGRQAFEPTDSGLWVSAEFHPGLAYVLMGATNLNPSVWSAVASPVQTNGATVGFSVEPAADAAFYKVVGELDFQ